MVITTNWPRDNRGKFLKHLGFPKGLADWMRWNENRTRVPFLLKRQAA